MIKTHQMTSAGKRGATKIKTLGRQSTVERILSNLRYNGEGCVFLHTNSCLLPFDSVRLWEIIMLQVFRTGRSDKDVFW